jgi:DNA-directed RNA polymerase
MIAVTQEQLEEQIALEREAIAQGLKRLRDNTMKLEQKDYASASIYGVASIDTLLPLVVERIQDTTNRIKEGKIGASFKEIQQYLADIEPMAAAAIACKLTFDKVFSYKEGANKLASVCDSIAHAVEDECQMRHYERVAPGLLRTIKDKYWHDSCGTHQKMALTQTLMNRYEVPEWSDWGRANRIKLGGWLLDCIMQASGWFTKMMMQEGRKRVTYVVPTAAFMDIKDEVMANAELFSPLAWPMLVPPNDWSNERAGGYILLITKVATDPLGNLPEWEVVEESWQFLAACEEYYYCVVEGSRQFTSLMVATDATCSGLQILAGLARDASTARLVNVLPSDTPQDAYKVVAEAAKADCPAHLIPYLDRKVTKRVVMTVPYNAKPFSNRGYIREALKEKGVEVSKEDLTVLVKAIRDAMDRIVPGPMAVMKWIETEVAKAIKAGSTTLTWTTPSGFVVTQKLMKPDVELLQLQLLGKVQKVSVKVGDSKEVDINHHKNATAPNLIHSLDASLLHIAATRFHAPIALIHDSVLCRATDMSILSSIVRETYLHLFAEHDYLKDFASQIGAETDPPIIGDLEPESVIESTYFFC